MDTVIQGEDKTITFNISDSSGAAVDLFAYAKIVVYVTNNARLPVKFSSVLTEGYETIHLSTTKGQLSFTVTSAHTTQYTPGICNYELSMHPIDGDIVKSKGDLFKIDAGITKDE